MAKINPEELTTKKEISKEIEKIKNELDEFKKKTELLTAYSKIKDIVIDDVINTINSQNISELGNDELKKILEVNLKKIFY